MEGNRNLVDRDNKVKYEQQKTGGEIKRIWCRSICSEQIFNTLKTIKYHLEVNLGNLEIKGMPFNIL